jgi:ABC-2 type transport system permease protein
MVLSGVVEEKSSRTVEVLLARVSARDLLAGKIAGIGTLGLAQISLTALVALIAGAMVDAVDVPAVRGGVLAWAVVWFVLGYALYATVFGTLGALASRAEDASSVAGPVTVVLVLGFMLSFAAIGSSYSTWARVVAWFPITAPFAMPNRIAMGAATWWDPLVAVALTVGTIAGLIFVGGRVYTRAILHNGATLSLAEAWRGEPVRATTVAGDPRVTETPSRTSQPTREPTHEWSDRLTNGAVIGIAFALGAAVFLLSHDVIVGVAVGAAVLALAFRFVKHHDAHRARPSAADRKAHG